MGGTYTCNSAHMHMKIMFVLCFAYYFYIASSPVSLSHTDTDHRHQPHLVLPCVPQPFPSSCSPPWLLPSFSLPLPQLLHVKTHVSMWVATPRLMSLLILWASWILAGEYVYVWVYICVEISHFIFIHSPTYNSLTPTNTHIATGMSQ